MFIAIELLPVLVKTLQILGPSTVYDDLVKAHERENRETGAHLSRRDADVARVRASDDVKYAGLVYDARRAVLETLAQRTAMAEGEVGEAALEEWKRREMARIPADLDRYVRTEPGLGRPMPSANAGLAFDPPMPSGNGGFGGGGASNVRVVNGQAGRPGNPQYGGGPGDSGAYGGGNAAPYRGGAAPYGVGGAAPYNGGAAPGSGGAAPYGSGAAPYGGGGAASFGGSGDGGNAAPFGGAGSAPNGGGGAAPYGANPNGGPLYGGAAPYGAAPDNGAQGGNAVPYGGNAGGGGQFGGGPAGGVLRGPRSGPSGDEGRSGGTRRSRLDQVRGWRPGRRNP
jgi:hypothetical protein